MSGITDSEGNRLPYAFEGNTEILAFDVFVYPNVMLKNAKENVITVNPFGKADGVWHLHNMIQMVME